MSIDYVSADMIRRLLEGTWATIILLTVSASFGLAIAVPMSLARMSKNRFLYWASTIYVFVFRGTPALVQLYFLYYGVAQLAFVRESALWAIFKSPWWCGLIALSMNTGAYNTEIFRGGLLAVPRPYIEAARAMGHSARQVFWLVSIPNAFRLALPAYSNELILLLKMTSIASTITILDLMGTGKLLYSETFDPFTPLLMAALFYLILVFFLTRAFALTEYLLFPHLRDQIGRRRRDLTSLVAGDVGR